MLKRPWKGAAKDVVRGSGRYVDRQDLHPRSFPFELLSSPDDAAAMECDGPPYPAHHNDTNNGFISSASSSSSETSETHMTYLSPDVYDGNQGPAEPMQYTTEYQHHPVPPHKSHGLPKHPPHHQSHPPPPQPQQQQQQQPQAQQQGRRGRRGGAGNFSEWEVGERYRLVRVLGNGSYGEVVEAFDTIKNRKVAIKRILKIFENETDARRIYREIYILGHLNHPGIIKLLDIIPPKNFESFQDLYLVFEFVDTDLYKLILSPQYLTNPHIQAFLYQLLVGLKYIHSANVIHRDLKPANILLNEDCTLKICDFGLARVIAPAPTLQRQMSWEAAEEEKRLYDEVQSPMGRVLTQHVVTRWYRAPELILLQDYTFAVDMWSVGCIFAELLSMQADSLQNPCKRRPLFPGSSCYPLSGGQEGDAERTDQLGVIFDVIGTPAPEDIGPSRVKEYLRGFAYKSPRKLQEIYRAADPSAVHLLSEMLQFNPDKRITVQDALAHPYLAIIREEARETEAPFPIFDCHEGTMNKEELRRRAFEEVMNFPRGLQ